MASAQCDLGELPGSVDTTVGRTSETIYESYHSEEDDLTVGLPASLLAACSSSSTAGPNSVSFGPSTSVGIPSVSFSNRDCIVPVASVDSESARENAGSPTPQRARAADRRPSLCRGNRDLDFSMNMLVADRPGRQTVFAPVVAEESAQSRQAAELGFLEPGRGRKNDKAARTNSFSLDYQPKTLNQQDKASEGVEKAARRQSLIHGPGGGNSGLPKIKPMVIPDSFEEEETSSSESETYASMGHNESDDSANRRVQFEATAKEIAEIAQMQFDASRNHSKPSLKKMVTYDSTQDIDDLPFIATWNSDVFFGVMITLNAVLIWLETDLSEYGSESFWIACEILFLAVFAVEFLLRAREHVKTCPNDMYGNPEYFFMNLWNLLEGFIVFMGIIDTVVLTIFLEIICNFDVRSHYYARIVRLSRLLRILRLLRFVQSLLELATGIMLAMKALGWALVLVFLTLFISSVVTTKFIGKEERLRGHLHEDKAEEFFGTMGKSMFTLFQLMTLEEWPTVARIVMKMAPSGRGGLWGIFFILFIIFTHLVLINLVTGIVLENVLASSRREEEKALQKEEVRRATTVSMIHGLFDSVLGDRGTDEIALEEFRTACQDPKVVKQFSNLHIAVKEAEELFVLMDTTKQGFININHFIEGCLRIRGAARAKHLLAVQFDVQKVWAKLTDQLDEIEDNVFLEIDRSGQELINIMELNLHTAFNDLIEKDLPAIILAGSTQAAEVAAKEAARIALEEFAQACTTCANLEAGPAAETDGAFQKMGSKRQSSQSRQSLAKAAALGSLFLGSTSPPTSPPGSSHNAPPGTVQEPPSSFQEPPQPPQASELSALDVHEHEQSRTTSRSTSCRSQQHELVQDLSDTDIAGVTKIQPQDPLSEKAHHYVSEDTTSEQAAGSFDCREPISIVAHSPEDGQGTRQAQLLLLKTLDVDKDDQDTVLYLSSDSAVEVQQPPEYATTELYHSPSFCIASGQIGRRSASTDGLDGMERAGKRRDSKKKRASRTSVSMHKSHDIEGNVQLSQHVQEAAQRLLNLRREEETLMERMELVARSRHTELLLISRLLTIEDKGSEEKVENPWAPIATPRPTLIKEVSLLGLNEKSSAIRGSFLSKRIVSSDSLGGSDASSAPPTPSSSFNPGALLESPQSRNGSFAVGGRSSRMRVSGIESSSAAGFAAMRSSSRKNTDNSSVMAQQGLSSQELGFACSTAVAASTDRRSITGVETSIREGQRASLTADHPVHRPSRLEQRQDVRQDKRKW